MKKKTHRILASLIFDIGLNQSVMYSPSVNVYFDFNKPSKPIRLLIKYEWSNIDLWYPFNDKTKALFTESGLKDWVVSEIKENLFQYKGDFIFDYKEGFYISSVGKEIGFVKDFEAAKKLYQND